MLHCQRTWCCQVTMPLNLSHGLHGADCECRSSYNMQHPYCNCHDTSTSDSIRLRAAAEVSCSQPVVTFDNASVTVVASILRRHQSDRHVDMQLHWQRDYSMRSQREMFGMITVCRPQASRQPVQTQVTSNHTKCQSNEVSCDIINTNWAESACSKYPYQTHRLSPQQQAAQPSTPCSACLEWL